MTTSEVDRDSSTRHETLVSIGPYSLSVLLLSPWSPPHQDTPHQPTIIFFPGSNDTFSSWLPLSRLLPPTLRILMYDRSGHGLSTGPSRQSPTQSAQDLIILLGKLHINPPYIPVAHSYGGAISREFIHLITPSKIAGLVLAETGQETIAPSSSSSTNPPSSTLFLGNTPLSVIRANSLLKKYQSYTSDLSTGTKSPHALALEKQMLDIWDAEDERLKKQQLKMSGNTRYRECRDCGHGIVRERPDVVAEEVAWVVSCGNRI